VGDELTGLQRAFVDAWFGDAQFNATEAARIAGYSGGNDPERERENWASQGSRTLRNVKVLEEMGHRWSAHGMTPAEVVAHYVEMARADIADLLQPGSGVIDWDKVHEHGNLVKKVVHRKGQEAQIELYDKQHALDMIGKTMAMFVDKQAVDVTTKGESLNERGVDTKAHRRAVSLLTDAFRAELADGGHGESGGVGANEQATARRDSK